MARTGYANHPTFGATMAWTYTLQTGTPFGEYVLPGGQPVVSVGGYVWVIFQDYGAGKDYLLCLDSTGTLQSKTHLLDLYGDEMNEQSPNLVTDSNDRCVVTFKHGLRCFQTNGTEAWNYAIEELSGMACAYACIGSDDRTWFTRYNNSTSLENVIALDTSGDVDTLFASTWYPNSGDNRSNQPGGLTLTDTHIYTTECDHATYAADEITATAKWTLGGSLVWRQDFTTTDLKNPILAPSVSGGHVYVLGESRSGGSGGNDGVCVSIKDSDGTLEWVSPFMQIINVPGTYSEYGIDGPPVDPVTGYVLVPVEYVTGADDKLVALDPADGSIVWTFSDADEGIPYGGCMPAIGNDGYCCLPRNNLSRIKISDGSLESKADLGAYLYVLGPALSENYVYVTATDGIGGPDRIFALDLAPAAPGGMVGSPFGDIAIQSDRSDSDMIYAASDTYIGQFTTSDPTSGATNADSLPTADAFQNGTLDAAFTLTVQNISTGSYKITGTVPVGYVTGDRVWVEVTAVVGGATWKAEVDHFQVGTPAAETVAALMAEVYEATETFKDYLRLTRAVLLGPSSGQATTSPAFADITNAKTRVTATADTDGNRSSVAVDAT